MRKSSVDADGDGEEGREHGGNSTWLALHGQDGPQALPWGLWCLFGGSRSKIKPNALSNVDTK
eukprot:5459466-Pyramimonas_sp.AAC.1